MLNYKKEASELTKLEYVASTLLAHNLERSNKEIIDIAKGFLTELDAQQNQEPNPNEKVDFNLVDSIKEMIESGNESTIAYSKQDSDLMAQFYRGQVHALQIVLNKLEPQKDAEPTK